MGETPLVNCGPRSYSLHSIQSTAIVFYCFLCKHLPLDTFNPLLQQAGEIDNLTVSLGQSTWVVLCRFRVGAGIPGVAPHHISRPSTFNVLLGSSWFDQPWFLSEEKLASIRIIPSSWGSQRTCTSTRIKHKFLAPLPGRSRHAARGVSTSQSLYFFFVLLYFIYYFVCFTKSKYKKIICYIKNTKKKISYLSLLYSPCLLFAYCVMFPFNFTTKDIPVGRGSIVGRNNIEEFLNHVSITEDFEDRHLVELAPNYEIAVAALVRMLETKFVNLNAKIQHMFVTLGGGEGGEKKDFVLETLLKEFGGVAREARKVFAN